SIARASTAAIILEDELSGSGRRRARGSGLRRSRRRAVVELLLGTEQEVEDLRAQALAEGHRQSTRDGNQQQGPTDPSAAAATLGGLAQRARGVSQGIRRLLELALELAILK